MDLTTISELRIPFKEEKKFDSVSGKTTVFRRYEKLEDEVIPLANGKNPPQEKINPDYKQQQ